MIRLRRLRSGTLAAVHLRRARRRAGRWLARQLRRAERHLDPLPRTVERAVVADGIAQGRADLQLVHTPRSGDALLADMYADPEHPLRRAVDTDLRRRADAIRGRLGAHWIDLIGGPNAGRWTACTLGTITATRPIGARVRFHAEPRGFVEGRLLRLTPSDVSHVHYRIEVGTLDGPREYDLPLSHPLEVLR